MTDLAEFLLARIAEDEAALVDYCRGNAVPVTLATATHRVLNVEDDLGRRVLAECEAKRRIVARCEDMLAGEDSWDPISEGGSSEPYDLARQAMHLLALPYADHDSYREEWKP